MFPIRTSATNTAGILYPGLCPTGFDPVLEQDIRLAAARSWRKPSIHSLPDSHREASVNCMTSSYCSAERVEKGRACQDLADERAANASRNHEDGIRRASQSVS